MKDNWVIEIIGNFETLREADKFQDYIEMILEHQDVDFDIHRREDL